jgi:hypothetical protein
MANSSTVSTCPLFPELENNVMTAPSGVYTLPSGSILPKGVGVGGVATTYNVSYDAWQSTANRNYELELHEKYPALRQAWEHYQNILGMCKSREEENSENRL